jgi:hypothetical protein
MDVYLKLVYQEKFKVPELDRKSHDVQHSEVQ